MRDATRGNDTWVNRQLKRKGDNSLIGDRMMATVSPNSGKASIVECPFRLERGKILLFSDQCGFLWDGDRISDN